MALLVVYLIFVMLATRDVCAPHQLGDDGAANGGGRDRRGGDDDDHHLRRNRSSVGSSVALTTVVIARALNAGAGPLTAALAGVAVAAITGLIVGSTISLLRITPFVVTLGAMTILRGAAKGVANEQKIDADARGLDSLLGVLPARSKLDDLSAGRVGPGLVAALAACLLRYAQFRSLPFRGGLQRAHRASFAAYLCKW